jgi:hypothetical protein
MQSTVRRLFRSPMAVLVMPAAIGLIGNSPAPAQELLATPNPVATNTTAHPKVYPARCWRIPPRQDCPRLWRSIPEGTVLVHRIALRKPQFQPLDSCSRTVIKRQAPRNRGACSEKSINEALNLAPSV